MKRVFAYGILIVVLALTIAAAWYFYPENKLPAGREIDLLVVTKSKRRLDVYSHGRIIKTYSIALGRNPVGHKQYEGDYRTPEGEYIINDKNPNSDYHKNLGVSYPDAADIARAKAQNVPPGGDIKLHGLRNGIGYIGKFHRILDWTAGCMALTDSEIDELYTHVKIGTPIRILP